MRAMPSGTAKGRLKASGQDGERRRADRADGEQRRGPAGQDGGPEQGDAEEQAAEDVTGAGDVEDDLHAADVAVRRAAGGGVHDVHDVTGVAVEQGRQHGDGDDLDGEQRQVAEGEDEVADKAEEAGLPVLAQVHARDARQGEDGHHALGGAAQHPLGGLRGEGGLGGWSTWTATKMLPATAAATPAALVRPVLVTFMVGSWTVVAGGSGDVQDARKRRVTPHRIVM